QGRLIVGSPGIGKTRLVAEVARRAAARGALVRYGKADEDGLGHLTADPGQLGVVIVDDLDLLGPDAVATVVSFLRSTREYPVLTLVTCRDPVRVGDLAGLPKLVLTALDDAAVAEIVRMYAPNTTGGTAVSAMANLGGVPARLHRAASEWAFARAGRRIDRAVEAAVEPRRWLTAARAEVRAGVLELAHVRGQARRLRPVVRETVSAYKGLTCYRVEDAEIFYGRERLVADAIARMTDQRCLAVIGAAGTGKSSLIQAGLLPALSAGVLPGSATWPQFVVTPEHGLAVAEVLAGLGEEAALIVVDQFEDAFTELDPVERAAFVDDLVAATEHHRVVLAIRSEAYPSCSHYPALAGLIAENTLLVPPMTGEDLRRAIVRPAALVGSSIEDGLAATMAAEAQSHSPDGDLTALSTVLFQMWAGPGLTMAGYQACGRVAYSVSRYAERAWAALRTEAEAEAGRRILLALIEDRDGRLVRRTVAEDQLWRTGGPGAGQALARLAEQGLLTITEDRVRIGHDALLSQWPRLREWHDEAAAQAALHQHLSRAASAWVEAGGGSTGIYSGVRLVAALDWAAANTGELTEPERAFLAASEQVLLAEEVRRRQRVARLWKWIAILTLALLAAIAVGALSVVELTRATAATQRAEAARLGAEAVAEPDLRLGLLLAVAAHSLEPTATPPLVELLRRAPDLVAAAGAGLTAVALSPDGRRLAAGATDGSILILDTEGLREVAHWLRPGYGSVNGLAFTPDGRELVSWAASTTAGIVVWDAATGAASGPAFGKVPPSATGGLLADGVTLLLAQRGLEGTAPTTVAWNIEARTPSTAYQLPAAAADGLAIAPGGGRVAWGTVDGTTLIEPADATTRPLLGATDPSAFSPDGRLLLTIDGAAVVLWDIDTGEAVGRAARHTADVLATGWSADGHAFASVGADGLIVVWDARTLQATKVFAGSDTPVRAVAFAADGRSVFTVGDDGAAFQWDLAGGRGVGPRVQAGLTPAALVDLACSLAGRSLTREEWQRHLPNQEYEEVCSATA
ncbi:MAG TPA: hypothetical protein VF163_18645, partial [Micromonosporaceae bacterium]